MKAWVLAVVFAGSIVSRAAGAEMPGAPVAEAQNDLTRLLGDWTGRIDCRVVSTNAGAKASALHVLRRLAGGFSRDVHVWFKHDRVGAKFSPAGSKVTVNGMLSYNLPRSGEYVVLWNPVPFHATETSRDPLAFAIRSTTAEEFASVEKGMRPNTIALVIPSGTLTVDKSERRAELNGTLTTVAGQVRCAGSMIRASSDRP